MIWRSRSVSNDGTFSVMALLFGRRSDRDNHRADRLERGDGIVHPSASAVAGCTGNLGIQAHAIAEASILAGAPSAWKPPLRLSRHHRSRLDLDARGRFNQTYDLD
jgi:hypothetical protein